MKSLDRQEIADAFDHAVPEAFENMAFMEVRRADDGDAPVPVDTCRWTIVELLTPIKGAVALTCCDALMAEIAETLFMGMDVPDGTDPKSDALGELANTIAGAVLAELSPENESIRLGLPTTGNGKCPADTTDYVYELDDGRRFVVGYAMATASCENGHGQEDCG